MSDMPTLGQGRKDLNILVIGDNAKLADEIKQRLGVSMGLSCHAWYCSRPDEANELMLLKHADIDCIFLDIAFGASHLKRRFLRLQKNIWNIPIIAITASADQALRSFIMAAGAADNIFHEQLLHDPGRLRNAMASCWEQNKSFGRSRQSKIFVLKRGNDRNEPELRDANDNRTLAHQEKDWATS